jgi:aminomethyltransferase
MAYRSPLDDLHRSLGSVFQEEQGWALPARYRDPIEEHRAVRERVGLVDLAFRTFIRVTGTERTRFLNGMLSNDIARLREGEGCYACLLNPQGKILADLNVAALSDCHLLEIDARWKERALDHLNKYVIADDVAFQELPDDILLAVQGPGAPSLLQRLVPGIVPPAAAHQSTQVTVASHPCRLTRDSLSGEEGYTLALSATGAGALWQALHGAGAIPVGLVALNTLRLEAGIPWFGVDFDEGNFPQEAGIEDRAVSFTKGCYIGQEFVIRIAHRGHVNRRIAGLTVEREPIPQPRDRILHEDKEVGRITSAGLSPTLGRIIALGMLRREWQEPGTAVQVESPDGSVPARVTPLPFYRRHPS